MAELQMLLDQEIPSGRQALIDSHVNLQKVASYCSQKYVNESNKKIALDETKNFTTQSLASVAYQINTLASNMLHMLDIQATQLASMDSAIHSIAQTVDIHKEKVARREIGQLTTNKVIARTHHVVAPQNPERTTKYVRKPVDYSELDDIGHGVKVTTQTGSTRKNSQASKKSPSMSTDGSSKRESLKSNTSLHGTLRIVKAPTVPRDFDPENRRLPAMFHSRASSNSSIESSSHGSLIGSTTGMGGHPPSPSSQQPPGMPAPPPPPSFSPELMPPPPPVVADLPPPPSMMSPQMHAPPPPPPPPAPISADSSGGYSTPNVGHDGKPAILGGSAETYAATQVMDLPPPPPQFPSSNPPFQGAGNRNPNLPMTGFASRITGGNMGIPPPPPPFDDGVLPPPPPSLNLDEISMNGMSMEPEWAPKEFLEKMVVIYDYSAENSDELNLREDQVVYVIKKNDDGWFEGVLEGVTGLFPGNYAEPIST